MIGTSFWTTLGYVALALVLIVVVLAMISVFIDLARDHDLGTGVKVIWMIAVILLPIVGLLAYIAVRGRGMSARSGATDTDTSGSGDLR